MGTQTSPAPDLNQQTTATEGTPTKSFVTKWQIPIHLVDNKHAKVLLQWPDEIRNGDLVSFTSLDGVPRVVFVGVNPFSEDPGYIIRDSGCHTVKNIELCTKEFPAEAYCWIKRPKSEDYVGYGPHSRFADSGTKVPGTG
jgi:hypothetical protein